MTKTGSVLAFSALFAAACASSPALEQVASESIINPQGHVIGHKDVVRDTRTGEDSERTTYYKPQRNAAGQVVAYEETVPEGVVIRATEGRRIGVRYQDLRTRGSNPGSGGVTVTMPDDASK